MWVDIEPISEALQVRVVLLRPAQPRGAFGNQYTAWAVVDKLCRHKSAETQPCSSASSQLDRNVHQSRSPRSEKSNVLSKTSGNYPSEQDDISTRASCGSTHDTDPSIQRTNPPSQLSPENENNTRERLDVLIFRSSTGPEQFMMESNYNVYGVHLSEYVVRADIETQPMDRFLMYQGDGLLSRGGRDVEGMEKRGGFGWRDDEIDLDLL